MKINNVHIHNFRSIKDVEFNVSNYTVLLGANNAGKTNILTALRVFYEDIKFDESNDFPKFETDDKESWIELEYELTNDEYNTLKEEYRGPNNTLKVRKYLKSEDSSLVKQRQSNIYAYENGELSKNLFYGAKNIGEAKLGKIIYIPELSMVTDSLKITGSSPLKQIIDYVMEPTLKEDMLESLNKEVDNIKETINNSETSIKSFVDKLNEELREWNIEFNLDINELTTKHIISHLLSYKIIDKNLNDEINIKNYGQGLQRQLIYTLLYLSPSYTKRHNTTKHTFSPNLTLLLFEEPEAFLHPYQQELLNIRLRGLSENATQVMITTHSPIFVSKNIEDIISLVRVVKDNVETRIFQIKKETMEKLTSSNNELVELLKSIKDNPNTPKKLKDNIDKQFDLNNSSSEIESIRYILWLDAERCSAFFSDFVLICEGATEKALIDYLLRNEWTDLFEKRIYVFDALGKFNLHRFMNLFGELGIRHALLVDKDNDKNLHKHINEFIENNKNKYTNKIAFLDYNIESFFDIKKTSKSYRKPIDMLYLYRQGKLAEEKIQRLKKIICELMECNS